MTHVSTKPRSPVAPPRANQWALAKSPVDVQSDKNGQFVVVRPGDTASTIAESLRKRGMPIPADLEAYYRKKTEGWTPATGGKHEFNLQVGTKFYLPERRDGQGQTYDSWLRSNRSPAPKEPISEPPTTAQTPSGATPAASAMPTIAPEFTGLVEGDAPISLSSLQKALSDGLAALPAATNREAVAASVDDYLSKHHQQLNSGSKASKDLYAAQLSWVVHAWAKDPAVLDDRGALWSSATEAAKLAVPG